MLIDLDAPGWFLDEREVLKGNRVKYTAMAIDSSVSPVPAVLRWVWKTSKPEYPLEFWSEVIAAEIGRVVGIEVPTAYPAVYQGESGALMANFVNREAGEVLDHGGDLLMAVKPDYERKKGKDHSVQLIIKALQPWDTELACYTVLFRQWLFDAIIGNQDRHQDNWGLVVTHEQGGEIHVVQRVAPAFDNGSSLCRELTEEGVAAHLSDPARLERYVARGRAHVRWSEGGNLIAVEHEELIRRHIEAVPESRAVRRGVLGAGCVGGGRRDSHDLRRVEESHKHAHHVGARDTDSANGEVAHHSPAAARRTKLDIR